MWKDIAIALLGIIATVLGFFGKTVIALLKDMLEEIKQMRADHIRTDEKVIVHEGRLNDHENRIRTLENQ